MKRLAALAALLLALITGPAYAQSTDRGVVQAFLEDNLSDAGRDVRVTGFEGALSGRATIDELTIADATGVWLTIRGAVFDWNRGALLRGRLEIAELSAKQIVMPRAPQTGDGMPTPEATPFVLPDLPVSIEIGALKVTELSLGAPLLGEATRFSLDGSADLSDGAGNARLAVTRLGGPEGRLRFTGAFSNVTRRLSLDLDLTEAADGIAANLLGLPGRPSLNLTIRGDGPVSNYAAQLGLSTDGQERLSGDITVADLPDVTDPTKAMRAFSAELSGDLRPLVEAQYRAFLGSELGLAVAGTRFADGRLSLEDVALTSAAMTVTGAADFRADGWPERLALQARIDPGEDVEVLLSIPGPETRVSAADLSLGYDVERGDAWTFDTTVTGLRRDDLGLTSGRFTGTGRLAPDLGRVDGALDLALTGITLDDADLAAAIGPVLNGRLGFDWTEGGALRLSGLDLSGQDYALTGDATVTGVEGQVDLDIDGAVQLNATDLSRFAGVLDQPVAGRAALGIEGQVSPVSGAFDLNIDGTARDLEAGIALLDPLLTGIITLDASARRDAQGLFLERLSIEGQEADIAANGRVASGDSDLSFALRLDDVQTVLPDASGPATLVGSARQTGPDWVLDLTATAPGEATARFDGTATLIDDVPGPVAGTLAVDIGQLTAYSRLAGRRISGALAVTAEATGDLRDRTVTADATGVAQSLAIGIPEADTLLRGTTDFTVSLRRTDTGLLVFDTLDVRTPNLTADLTGSVSAARSRVRYAINLRDLGLFVSGLNGPVFAEGAVASDAGPVSVNSALRGPGGVTATLDGQVARDGSSANLAISGAGPLALANRFIAPNLAEGTARFDLRLDGQPGLSSLSGTVRSDGARLTLPALRAGLADITAEARLGGGAADFSATGAVSTGGRVALTGRSTLTAPYNADLAATLTSVALSQPGVYETTVDGRLAVAGPLLGGAALTGDLALGPAEIRIPDGAASSGGDLPGLVHLNEPAAVRQTRVRAGLIDTGNGRQGPDYPLDVIVRAPSRIFIRGRGLDAELGGALRLTGTTNSVVTEGRFDLVRGRLDILGKRLNLTEAFAQLQGDFDPFVRAVATTQTTDATIQVIVEGLASAPTVTFTSTPDLPEDEILARLLFGRDLSEISPLQALQMANAVRVLAGGSGEGVVGRLRQNFGLDDLDFAAGQDGEAGVRVGKYISDNIYTDVTVDTSGRSEINLNLTISPSITARGSASSDGNTGVGLFFERDY